jgi:hypothetical protein
MLLWLIPVIVVGVIIVLGVITIAMRRDILMSERSAQREYLDRHFWDVINRYYWTGCHCNNCARWEGEDDLR